jgi:protein-S-isoprenylcysteine O-methyltransferase Ste14
MASTETVSTGPAPAAPAQTAPDQATGGRSASGRARPDLGKMIMVPTAVVMLLLDMFALTHGGGLDPLRLLRTAAICAFYALIIWCYLRRAPAIATSGSVTAYVAAVTATMIPFAFPLLPAGLPGAGQQFAGDALLLAGTAWAVWSLRFLGRNLSVLAQARDVVDRGPYRLVRHPLYAGEIVSGLGLALCVGTVPAFAVWLALCGLQAYRALREEQVLLGALPGYRGYRARTAALLPGLF